MERFGDELPIAGLSSGANAYQNLLRITQAGRAILDRTQSIANIALIVAIIRLVVTSAAWGWRAKIGFVPVRNNKGLLTCSPDDPLSVLTPPGRMNGSPESST